MQYQQIIIIFMKTYLIKRGSEGESNLRFSAGTGEEVRFSLLLFFCSPRGHGKAINCALPSLLGLDIRSFCVCALIKLLTRKIPFHSLKRLPLWLIMIDDAVSAPTHERRKLVKTYKNYEIVYAMVCPRFC